MRPTADATAGNRRKRHGPHERRRAKSGRRRRQNPDRSRSRSSGADTGAAGYNIACEACRTLGGTCEVARRMAPDEVPRRRMGRRPVSVVKRCVTRTSIEQDGPSGPLHCYRHLRAFVREAIRRDPRHAQPGFRWGRECTSSRPASAADYRSGHRAQDVQREICPRDRRRRAQVPRQRAVLCDAVRADLPPLRFRLQAGERRAPAAAPSLAGLDRRRAAP